MKTHEKLIRIAVVDDHYIFRIGLSNILTETKGFEVVIQANNGFDFLKQIESLNTNVDIALIDISMPEMDGFELLLHLNKRKINVSPIGLSVSDDYESVFRMIDQGAKAFLVKDCEESLLIHCIKTVYSEGFYYDNFVMKKITEYHHQLEITKATYNMDNVKITEKELLFLKFCCSEKNLTEIADELCVSKRTVDGYRDSLFGKLNVKTRIGLVLFAIEYGIYLPKYKRMQSSPAHISD